MDRKPVSGTGQTLLQKRADPGYRFWRCFLDTGKQADAGDAAALAVCMFNQLTSAADSGQ